MLKENNVRQGFFEPEQFQAVLQHMPAVYHGLIKFAYFTGWRWLSEIQTRQWKHVDWQGGAVGLEPGETKNKEGRMFPFHVMPELQVVLELQLEKHRELQRRGVISPWVFCREDGAAIKDFRGS
jgi:integrase